MCIRDRNNGEYVDDFWKFDPSTESWTQLRDISDSSDEDYDDDYTITVSYTHLDVYKRQK